MQLRFNNLWFEVIYCMNSLWFGYLCEELLAEKTEPVWKGRWQPLTRIHFCGPTITEQSYKDANMQIANFKGQLISNKGQLRNWLFFERTSVHFPASPWQLKKYLHSRSYDSKPYSWLLGSYMYIIKEPYRGKLITFYKRNLPFIT